VDTAAFDVWVDEVGPDLLRFARITTRNLDPADLVQETLVAVFLRWSRLGDAGQADAYARRVILNGHVSRWRKWGRRVTVVDPATITEVGPDEGSRSDDVVTARQLLGALPVTQRAAVFMRFYDDLTYREITAVIGCREATARSYVHRALTQLRHQLDGSSSR
jgi:RNA polymerase sigma factor (sigma-70 family)